MHDFHPPWHYSVFLDWKGAKNLLSLPRKLVKGYADNRNGRNSEPIAWRHFWPNASHSSHNVCTPCKNHTTICSKLKSIVFCISSVY